MIILCTSRLEIKRIGCEMKKKQFKVDLIWFGIFFVAFLLIAKIVFFKESIIIITKLISFLFLFVIAPGFSLTYFIDNLIFIERFVIGTCLMFAVVGVGSVILGFFRVHYSISTILLIVVCYMVGIILIIKANKKKEVEVEIK